MGKVERFAIITPRHIKLSGPVGETLKSVVTIIPEKKYPFRIIEAHAERGNFIRFEVKAVNRNNQPVYRLTIENTRDTAGRYFDTIRLLTDNEIQQEIGIWVFGDIKNRSQ